MTTLFRLNQLNHAEDLPRRLLEGAVLLTGPIVKESTTDVLLTEQLRVLERRHV